MEIKNHTKTKIGVGSVVKTKVGELEKITKEVRSRSIRKEVVGCVQSMVGKKKFFFWFKRGNNKEIIYSLLVFLISKEEVDMDGPISHLPKKNKVNCWLFMGILRLDNLACLLKLFICICFIVCVVIRIDIHIWQKTRWWKRDIRTWMRRRISY